MGKNKIVIERLNKSNIRYVDDIDNIQGGYEHLVLSRQNIIDDIASPSSYYIIAKLDDNILGFCGINILYDHADITGMAVKKDFERHGIGRILMNSIFQKCRDLNIMDLFLEVRASNIAALGFYENIGFKQISKRKGYYDKGLEDAYIYTIKMED